MTGAMSYCATCRRWHWFGSDGSGEMAEGLSCRRGTPPRTNRAGVPADVADWTVEDWRELHEGVERIKAAIAARHRRPASPSAPEAP